ncbi:MAG: 2-polyprenyl-3-methyl-5-hydroxy-6-metoxy-1,4-benzoquinol methylase [Planctomycetota bacterium]|jgi:2-polyprenyl-3-methyl-5-hydroxy-6-metoxy-1,4-benzoquinol methylase
MRILVAIANHGTKNRAFLDRLLAEYARMPHEVYVVVLSDQPKPDLNGLAEVLVGAPTSNPWSLPFAHRALFAERKDQYDLFIYSEDDTLLTPRNLSAFLEVKDQLAPTQVPGFLRYERYGDGRVSYCGVHFHYHWEPESAFRVGQNVFARYTNEHSALYVLDRAQLQRCIDSGEYLVAPHEGRYDMLVSAATDPYTRCGLERVVCVNRVEDFLLHHLPDVYLGKIGTDAPDVQVQLEALLSVVDGETPAGTLFDGSTQLAVREGFWNKRYYEKPRPRLAARYAKPGKSVLSLGVGSGQLEADWIAAGAQVTGIPMDAVIGAMAARRGVEMLPPNLEDALEALGERRFDVLLLPFVLEHVEDPVAWLRRLVPYLKSGGMLLALCLNQPGRLTRAKARGEAHPLPRPLPFSHTGIHYTDAKVVRSWMQAAGLRPERTSYALSGKAKTLSRLSAGIFDARLGQDLVQIARP